MPTDFDPRTASPADYAQARAALLTTCRRGTIRTATPTPPADPANPAAAEQAQFAPVNARTMDQTTYAAERAKLVSGRRPNI